MPLSWNEIKSRAYAFSRSWADVSSEDAEAKTFWNEFFHVFGISRRRVATFEERVKKIDGRDGYIDLLWKGMLLIEHKSKGKDLDRAHQQALDYFPGLKERDLPQYIVVSDFARFRLYDLEEDTHEDGSDLGHHLATLFHVLNTPEDKRLKNLDEQLAAFPYINGNLFAETLPPAAFDAAMRQSLLDCCGPDWSRISPAIFGSLFQSIMDKTARRNLGAHYTSEKNILKLIRPLFLDALWEKFEKIKTNKNKLNEFHNYLRSITFLDPACGCGNFLVIAYRELRELELAVLRALHTSGQQILDVRGFIRLDIDQFFGIEIEEFPAQIAQVALWLMDHQMNLKVSEEFGLYFARIPLKTSANIICGNALRMDWNEVIPAGRLSYIMGNPPFVGKSLQSDEQKADMRLVFNGRGNPASLDFVSAWYVKAADMMSGNPALTAAFVSTNSIAQGEQVAGLWPVLLGKNIHINFAHRTFQWNNEARGKAAVHCVIIGFALNDIQPKWLFDYEDIKGEPQKIKVQNINPYLVDASNIVLENRRRPIGNTPEILFGSKPVDGGNLLLSENEMKDLKTKEEGVKDYIKIYLSAEDFIHNSPRYCLWLKDCPPEKLKLMPLVISRVSEVRKFRLSSTKEATRKASGTPTLFAEDRQPIENYLAIPKTSSERRLYIPIGFMKSYIVVASELFTICGAGHYHFGILTSVMHNAWMRIVCGRLKNDYRYSASIVYNNFPWPENPGDNQKQAIEAAAQAVLDARAQFPDASLADLYDPLTMPPVLLNAHQKLDKAVDAAYGKKTFPTEAARVAFLFELYQNYIRRSGPCPR